jgi:cell division protein FtsL
MKLSTIFKVFKTFVISMMLIVIVINCSQSTEPEPEVKPVKSKFDNTKLIEPSMVIIDGCEYIQYRTYYQYYGITPNIKPLMNKIDSLNKEIDELKKQLNK